MVTFETFIAPQIIQRCDEVPITPQVWVQHDRPDHAREDLQWSHLLTEQASKFPSKCLRSLSVMNRVCLRIFKQEHGCVCDCCGKCRSWSGATSHSLTWPWAGHQHGSSHRLACLFAHLRVDPNRCHCIAQMQRLPLRELKCCFQNVVVAEVELISLSCYEESFLLQRPRILWEVSQDLRWFNPSPPLFPVWSIFATPTRISCCFVEELNFAICKDYAIVGCFHQN